MNLTYPERLALIDMTKARLAKVRLYVAPTRPSNNNRSLDNRNWGDRGWSNQNCDADKRDPCLRLVDKVGSSWQIRRASLLAIANGSENDAAVMGLKATKTS